MSAITIRLQPEIERRLKEKAKQDGETLESLLERLAEHAAGNGNSPPAAGPETDDEELAERPWRGVFVPPRRRKVLFTHDLAFRPESLPKRQPSLNMSWHRAISDDE
jgi:hypothetical protein